MGYVYIIKATAHNIFKIGCTSDLKGRIASHQYNCYPTKISVEYIIKVQDHKALEAELHRHFHSKRIRYEWFRLDADDFKYLKLNYHLTRYDPQVIGARKKPEMTRYTYAPHPTDERAMEIINYLLSPEWQERHS